MNEQSQPAGLVWPSDGLGLVERLRDWADDTYTLQAGELPDVQRDLAAAADEIERLRAALATESSRKCATEHDCVWQPHCGHAGKCMRPERPFGA